MNTFTNTFKKVIGSKYFFYSTLGIFLFSSIWIALSGRYPLAFDENYHYEIIKHYAAQLSPFFSHPPAGSEALGDITRYPSYLFHYLMSFPYRFISIFTDSDMVKIIFLRLINVALLVSSLFIFKKLFEKVRFGAVASNLALLFFVLTPIVPFLAAHINYDNVVIPATGIALILLVDIVKQLKNGIFDIKKVVLLLIVCMLTCLVKYTFLPIFLGVGLAGVFVLIREVRRQKLSVGKIMTDGYKQLTVVSKIGLAVGVIITGGLFVERYGLNVVRYGVPNPDCGQVLSTESCLQYGPWGRDYQLKQQKHGPPTWNAARYSGHWAAQNMHETFFAIDQNYQEKSPLPVIYYGAWFFGVLGLILMVFNWRKIRRLEHVHLFVFIVGLYVGVLWLENYRQFLGVNWPVAIHGRYLLPLLPVIYVLLAYTYKNSFLKLSPKKNLQAILGTVALICMLNGGLVTYIVRSSGTWYWSNDVVLMANHYGRAVLEKLTIN